MNYIKIPLDGHPVMLSMIYIYAGFEVINGSYPCIEEIEICNNKLDTHDIPDEIKDGLRNIIYKQFKKGNT